MSVTNLTIVTRALRAINVLSEVDVASPEQGRDGLAALNGLMSIWSMGDIDNLGWIFQDKINDTCPIPEWAEDPVMANLAIFLAPQYGATVSQELGARAQYGLSTLRQKAIREKLDNADMSHLPEGTGHFGARYDINEDR